MIFFFALKGSKLFIIICKSHCEDNQDFVPIIGFDCTEIHDRVCFHVFTYEGMFEDFVVKTPCPRGYKTFVIIKSAEHEIYPNHIC